ncbi:response regulator [Roseateles sp. 22389]|uniref:response regulator n=1 Tax=Roseateles sp. 22389 TaxID=3453916 RepID=UPI003F84DEF0
MRVVVVENCLPTRRLLTLLLTQKAGASVVAEAADEEAAVAAVHAFKPHLVTLDLGLDEGSGVGVLKRLRAGNYEGLIYVFSSEERSVVEEHCIRLGADGFFDKSRGETALVEAAMALGRSLATDACTEERTSRDDDQK